jgi:hypothetical protein
MKVKPLKNIKNNKSKIEKGNRGMVKIKAKMIKNFSVKPLALLWIVET